MEQMFWILFSALFHFSPVLIVFQWSLCNNISLHVSTTLQIILVDFTSEIQFLYFFLVGGSLFQVHSP